MGNCCMKNKENINTTNKNNNKPNNKDDENKYKPPPIIDWVSSNKTYNYHWWPMLERNENDIINNLYAEDGGLGKYDSLFNTKSCEYQRLNHYRSLTDETKLDKYWAGFCDRASILSCSYKYPENNVILNYNKNEITFTPKDIEALMIIASDNAINKGMTIFFGERNNNKLKLKSKSLNDPNEPYPSSFIDMLEAICKFDNPFIMDIDNDNAVWNYAYDKVLVTKHKSCPIEHEIPTERGLTTYYNFKIESIAYPKNNLDLWGYINITYSNLNNECHKKMNEGWITKNNPDFIWKVFPKKCIWEGTSSLNPHINSEIVYRLYKHSFDKKINKNQ